MSAFVFMVATVCASGAAIYYWEELFAEEADARAILVSWAIRGVVAPVAVWMFFNLGLASHLPPIWPEFRILRATSGSWFFAMLTATTTAAVLILSIWVATTLGWMTATIALRTAHRDDFAAYGIFWSIVLLPLAGLMIYSGGPTRMGLAVSIWLTPIVHFTYADARLRKIGPLYSRAVARLKFGKYADAEQEVIVQLEKHADDFDGWMMLAEIYANHFGDLGEADRTIRDLCEQPNVSHVQMSLALHRLADWHLKLRNDPDAACAALVELCRKAPGTHFARMAQLRISQLPVTRQDLVARRERKLAIPAPAASWDDRLDEAVKSTPRLERVDALAIANDHAARLKDDPNNVAARERFAIVLAEELGKIDLALEQMELLLGIPDQPEKKMASWLGLMAKWQLKYRRDEKAAALVMQRLVHEYPQSTEAFAAQRHLNLLEAARRWRRANRQIESGLNPGVATDSD